MGVAIAIMPMKCIDQMPPPSAKAPARSHSQCTVPVVARSRPARFSAVKDARQATTTDMATQNGSSVLASNIRLGYGQKYSLRFT